jgi:hypothetical protein
LLRHKTSERSKRGGKQTSTASSTTTECHGAVLRACKNGVASSHRVWRADEREEFNEALRVSSWGLPLI